MLLELMFAIKQLDCYVLVVVVKLGEEGKLDGLRWRWVKDKSKNFKGAHAYDASQYICF